MTDMNLYQILDSPIEKFMIPAERVAHVQLDNTLDHALLVLTKSGYTAVPVLHHDSVLHGIISTTTIMEAIIGMERFEFEKLSQLKVSSVVKHETPMIELITPLHKCIQLLVDHPFICIRSEQGRFIGIVTRHLFMNEIFQEFKNYRKQTNKKSAKQT